MIEFTLNGKPVRLDCDPSERLLDIIRDRMGLTGTKEGCGEGECGACSVLVNGRLANSCLVAAGSIRGADVLTIEGLAQGDTLHPLQQAFAEHGAVQCGFCTPGMIMNAYAMLLKNPKLTRAQILAGMENNLCRCAAHKRIVEAIESVAAGKRG